MVPVELMAKFKKVFVAELIEIGDGPIRTVPTATFKWTDNSGQKYLVNIEMPEDDLREITTAFYQSVLITLEFPSGDR